MKTPHFIEKIDWSELRNQKIALINHIAVLRKDQSEVNQIAAKNELADHFEGILALIDAVQDYAVDEMGMNANDIYDIELEESRDAETPEEKFARENANIIYDMHVDGSFIYENEEMNEDFIKSILDNEQHASTIKTIIRNAILTDIENGIIGRNQLEYSIEMYDYGYKIEDYCLEQFYKDKTKTVWVCDNCGSDNVQGKSWVSLNTNVIDGAASDGESDDFWCEDCEEHHNVTQQTMPYLKEVIGFQVVSTIGEGVHPDMGSPDCVYNISQVNDMFNGSNIYWKLLTIWSGDIVNPFIMFKGNPRD